MRGNPITLKRCILNCIGIISQDNDIHVALFLNPNGNYETATRYEGQKTQVPTNWKLIDFEFSETVRYYKASCGSVQEDYEKEITKFIELTEWSDNPQPNNIEVFNQHRSVWGNLL